VASAIVPREPRREPEEYEPVILFDRERVPAFTTAGDTSFTGVWTPTPADQRGGWLAKVLSPSGRVLNGTSVWFVGATGLASCADDTVFELVDAPGEER
jgi:hypothetical protein